MVRVLFIHGMRHERLGPKKNENSWFPAFDEALERTRVARGRRAPLPKLELELVYWGDLFDEPRPEAPLKGLGDALADVVYATVREAVRQIDRVTEYDPFARPRSVAARVIDAQIYQTAMYMSRVPVRRGDSAEASVYDQIQHRFREALARGADIVIGHSLGSVIAYEGLCRIPHKVSTLLTIGSPIGVRKLIYERLRPTEAPPRTAPSVRRWINVSNLADAMVVPVPRIQPLFRGPVSDVLIHRGKLGLRSLTKNHEFVHYLGAAEVGEVITDAVEEALARQTP